MALRLGPYIKYGEFYNLEKNSVHGYLCFFGNERPLSVQLYGNFLPKWAGKRIRFEPRDSEPPAPPFDFKGLAWLQVGPAGVMRPKKYKVLDSDYEKASHNAKMGLSLPYTCKPGIFLEWFCQNGRVVLEMIDPVFEVKTPEEYENEPRDEYVDLDPDELMDRAEWDVPLDVDSELERIREFESDGEDVDEEENEAPDPTRFSNSSDESKLNEDPYGLFPKDLQKHLDRETEKTERTLGFDDSARTMAEIQLMDSLLNDGEEKPLSEIFDKPITLPHPDVVSEAEVVGVLQVLLANLALNGIGIHVCKHFNPLQAYRLIVKEILKGETVFTELKTTGWTQNFMTSEYCKQCDEEFEARYAAEHGEDEEEEDEEGGDNDKADGSVDAPF